MYDTTIKLSHTSLEYFFSRFGENLLEMCNWLYVSIQLIINLRNNKYNIITNINN